MFESLKGKTKSNLTNIRNILSKMDVYVDNSELSAILWNNLNNYLKEKRYYIELANREEVIIKKKKSRDEFHLIITPSLDRINSVAMHIVDQDGNREEDIVVQLKRETGQIIVMRSEIKKTVQGKKKDVTAIVNKTIVRNYIDKILRYEYEYMLETCYRLSLNYSAATVNETFIDLDKNAVKRSAHISEDAYYDNPAEISYYESNNYVHPPFNDQYGDRTIETNFKLSTEEKFNEFVNGNNNIVNIKVKKKMD